MLHGKYANTLILIWRGRDPFSHVAGWPLLHQANAKTFSGHKNIGRFRAFVSSKEKPSCKQLKKNFSPNATHLFKMPCFTTLVTLLRGKCFLSFLLHICMLNEVQICHRGRGRKIAMVEIPTATPASIIRGKCAMRNASAIFLNLQKLGQTSLHNCTPNHQR